MAMDSFNISWVTALPASNALKKSAIYIVKPSAGVKPSVYVTNATGTEVMQINPDTPVGDFIKSVNNIQGVNGNVSVDLVFNASSGILTFTGGSTSVNFDARYVKLSDYTPWKTATDGRLTSLESAITEGLRTPKPFDANAATVFPNGTKGDTYKVTVAGTVSGVVLEVGDTLIYDTTGNTPYVVQTNVDQATTTAKGLVRIATQAEVTAGVETTAVVVSSTLQSKLNTFLTSITASQAEVTAGVLTNKFLSPLTYKNDIASVKANSHTHTNKATIDKFSEDATGSPLFDGKGVFTLGVSEW